MFYSFSSAFFFIGDKIAADNLKDEITTSIKANNRLKCDQDVSLHSVRDKGKPQYKLSYKILQEEYGYDTLLDISSYPTLIQLKYFIGRIHNCVRVVGKWNFDIKFPFALHITKDNLDYCFINDHETKVKNGYKGVLR